MKKSLLKNLSFFIGGITLLVTGLMYVLITDLYLSNSSVYLLLGIILALSGSICFILSESFRDKIKVFYILKGIGIFMSIGFIVFLFLFMKTEIFGTNTYFKLFKKYQGRTIWFLSRKFQSSDTQQIVCSIKPIYIVNIVLAITAVLIQGANLGMNIIFGVEE